VPRVSGWGRHTLDFVARPAPYQRTRQRNSITAREVDPVIIEYGELQKPVDIDWIFDSAETKAMR
jgi:hypothetical protein